HDLVDRLERTPRSLGPFKVYLGLDFDVSQHGLPSHEYLFYDDYDHDRTFAALERGEVSMVSAYSPVRADPGLAPKGHSTLILTSMFPWRPTERDWREHEAGIANEMIAKVERKIPGLREHIRERVVLTPEDLRRFSNATDGAMYGWANVPEASLLRRLRPASPIGGLFHVGHWTQPGTGVTTAISSGYQIALEILQNGHRTRTARLASRVAAVTANLHI
ncbi:MAG: hypothetical protein K8H88_32405, partial [Sandaracinaceae bacterium]|nr:hypothetical protein [Sandaracinaceae bacterium]